MQMCMQKGKQMELLRVKEDTWNVKPAKCVNIVSLEMVIDASILYKDRNVRFPQGFL